MILFIIIAICILIYTIFAKDGLIDEIKKSLSMKYKKIRSILKDIGWWIFANVVLNGLNLIACFLISAFMLIVLCNTCPSETSHWEFDINALQDNLVAQGEFRGRYASRGYIDGELSYFYLRPMSMGEKVEHIPANKTYVQYSDDERPHVEVHQSRIDIPEWMNKVFWLKSMNEKTTDYYVIVVPEGTITNTGQYEIDMK